MVNMLMEVGPMMNTDQGSMPVTATELKDWCILRGVELTSWQAQTLLNASRAYTNQYASSFQKITPPPYLDPFAEENRSSDDDIRAVFRGLMQSQKQGRLKGRSRKPQTSPK